MLLIDESDPNKQFKSFILPFKDSETSGYRNLSSVNAKLNIMVDIIGLCNIYVYMHVCILDLI